MKCPFLVKRREIFDKEGKKVGEELEIKDCIKNECMVYDGAAKLCSLLSSNIKSGILIDDFKTGIKELKDEMFQRAEATGVIISTTIQTMQDALLSRFDLLKKQNEIIVLGFDRLFESQGLLLNGVREFSEKMTTSFTALNMTASAQVDGFKALQELGEKIAGNQMKSSEEMMKTFGDVNMMLKKLDENVNNKLELLRVNGEKLSATNQVGLETISSVLNGISELVRNEIGGIKTENLKAIEGIAAKFDAISESLKSELGSLKIETLAVSSDFKGEVVKNLDLVRSEIGNLNHDLKNSLGDFQSMVMKYEELFSQTQANIAGVNSTLNDTGRNYVESITRLVELTGNVSQGVEKTGSMMGARIEELTSILKSEVSGMKAESRTSLENIQGGLAKFEGFLSQSLVNLTDIAALVGALNKNYLESLERMFGLADGIRQGVEKTGEGVNAKIDELSGAVKNELAILKTDMTAPVTNIQNGVMKFEELFDRTQSNIGNMSEMMSNLNKNYIESLSKIAGLAEGMRKGVESVGTDMHSSAKGLVGEMKNEIGALEKQYEKTFSDISKLAEKLEELNRQIAKMTHEVQREFQGSFERQSELSAFTSEIVKHIKDYFDKEDARYKEEQAGRQKKEALDHFDRATLYYYRGNYELALNEIDKAMEKEKLAEYMNLKGLLLTELGRADEAKRIYLEALKIEPNLAEIYNNLGLLYLKTKKLNDAVSSFQEAIKRNVNYALAYVHLGKALIEQERYDEAMSAYEKALEIDPANKAAREAIGLYKEGKVGG